MNYLRNEEVKKQPPELFCPQQFCKILGKTPVPESLFYQSCTSQPATLLKKRLVQVFQGEFCQTSKNTSWRLLLKKTFPPPQKKKNNSKTHLCEKNLFMMIFIISFFLISSLHDWWRLPYLIKDDIVEGFRGL